MKKILFLILITFASLIGKAQYVTIPDSNFRMFLKDLVPSAMFGDDLFIYSSALPQISKIDCSNLEIKNLEGIQYFDSLKELNCGFNKLATIPELPQFLEWLTCHVNTLNSLPLLPKSLRHLDCDKNQLTSLPVLPTKLNTLYCNDNLLTLLPTLSDSLEHLWCRNNKLTSLPVLPPLVKILHCNTNKLSSLPNIPDSLITLYCNKNQLVSLPPLPNSLVYLSCESNQLSSLPALPNSIIVLWCNYNLLTNLPSLPSSLSTLVCSDNLIDSLPSLPNELTELFCHVNRIKTLPELPSSLKELHCYANQLEVLPSMPSSLEYLDCSRNKITELLNVSLYLKQLYCSENLLTNLPILNDDLRELHCDRNKITSMPFLPRFLETLYCQNNRLAHITNIPDRLRYFDCTGNINLSCLPGFYNRAFITFKAKTNTEISCLPLAITADESDGSDTLPICDRISNCAVIYNVSGKVYQDTANCSWGKEKQGSPLTGIKVQQYEGLKIIEQTYTDGNGLFGFNVPVGKTLRYNIDDHHYAYEKCDIYKYINVQTSNSIAKGVDFGIKCSKVDLQSFSINGDFIIGKTSPVYIYAGDISNLQSLNCAEGISGTVTTTITGSASYVSPYPDALTPSSVKGNTLTYNIADFGAIEPTTAFNIILNTNSNALIGSDICIETLVSTSANDVNSSNDTLLFCSEVVNSYDRNDKAAYPRDVTAPNSWITYTIRYQNTGIDTAYDIFMRDTLSSYLDENTFTYLNGSVRPQIHLTGKAILFNFPNVNLVDSLSNEPESRGWVQYKVKTKADLNFKDTIENTAYIYFGKKNPVLTNTTSNVYIEPTVGIKRDYLTHPFSVYPNPTAGNITIAFEENHSEIRTRILSIAGQEITTDTSSNSNKLQFDFDAAKGIYFIEISTEEGGKAVVKVVKE